MKLSFVVPAYNEEKTLEEIIRRVLSLDLDLEIIIVNDASKDNTLRIAEDIAATNSKVKVLNNERNLGKSQSVREGILATVGDYIVIQDADLEYDPNEVVELFKMAENENLDVVYGNRFGKHNKVIYWQNYIGNKGLSAISNIFTFFRIWVWIPDMEVCYKLIRGGIARDIAKNIDSKTNFGFEPEITAKLSRYKKEGKHLSFKVMPISYFPRSIAEGKHMKAIEDGFKALLEILKFNLF